MSRASIMATRPSPAAVAIVPSRTIANRFCMKNTGRSTVCWSPESCRSPFHPPVLASDLEGRGFLGPEHRQLDHATDAGTGGRRDHRLLLGELPAGLPGEQEQPVHPVQRGVDPVGPIEVGGDMTDSLLDELLTPSGANQRERTGARPG